jgi:hypothetical protein
MNEWVWRIGGIIPTRKQKYSELTLTHCQWVHHKLPALQAAKIVHPSEKFLFNNIHKFSSRLNVPQNTLSVKIFWKQRLFILDTKVSLLNSIHIQNNGLPIRWEMKNIITTVSKGFSVLQYRNSCLQLGSGGNELWPPACTNSHMWELAFREP